MPAGQSIHPNWGTARTGKEEDRRRDCPEFHLVSQKKRSPTEETCALPEPVASNSKDFLNKPGRVWLVLQSKWDSTVQRTANPAPLLPTYPSNQIGLCQSLIARFQTTPRFVPRGIHRQNQIRYLRSYAHRQSSGQTPGYRFATDVRMRRKTRLMREAHDEWPIVENLRCPPIRAHHT